MCERSTLQHPEPSKGQLVVTWHFPENHLPPSAPSNKDTLWAAGWMASTSYTSNLFRQEVEMTHALVCLLGVGTTAFFYICIVSYHSCFLISYPGSHRLPPVPQWSPQVDLQTPHTHTESHHGIVLADSRVKILGVCSSPISLSRGVGPCAQPNTHPIPRVSETLVLSLAAASAAQEQTHVKHQVHSYLL